MYLQCRGAWGEVGFPDGRAVLHQPVILAEAWRHIGHYVEAYREKKS